MPNPHLAERVGNLAEVGDEIEQLVDLDTHTGEAILNLFHELNRQGRTIAAVTRRRIELRDGRLVS